MSVRVTADGLEIDGEIIDLVSASVQPWRLDPLVWPAVLDKVRGLGFGIVEVYVPWGEHEDAAGRCDFTGPRDIGAFLDLVHERGLKAVVRPGPHVNAEITGFGFPERILRNESLFARGPEGNPIWMPAPPRGFPAVSYASEKLYREFGRFLDELAPVIRSRLHPNGPVVALQADNEMTLFFRTAAFDMDYSPSAQAEYRAFVRSRYGTLAKLNRAYGLRLESFEALVPPVRFDAQDLHDLPRYLDWAAYKEHHLRRAVARVANLLRARGLGTVPFTHNYPLGDQRSPLDLPALENEIDLVGMDMYYRKRDYHTIKARCLALCGLSRFPYAPEFGSGSYLSWPPTDLHDQIFATLAATMHGLRGMNFYMIVDRERWYGAPIRRDGSEDPERAAFYRRFLGLFRRIHRARRCADTVLLTTRLCGRLENLSNAFDPLSPMALAALGLGAEAWCRPIHLGSRHAIAAQHATLQDALSSALTRVRLCYDLGEAGRGPAALSAYRLAVLPTLEIMEREATTSMLEFVRQGGTLVMGPEVPCFDGAGHRDTTFRSALRGRSGKLPGVRASRVFSLGSGHAVVVGDLHERGGSTRLDDVLRAASHLAGCTILPEPGDPELDVAIHGDGQVLWLANPTGMERLAVMKRRVPGRLRDCWDQTSFAGRGRIEIPMPPYSIRPLEAMT